MSVAINDDLAGLSSVEGTGTVTGVSFASANGFSAVVADPLTTPEITLKMTPDASATPDSNGDALIEATSDTSATYKFKGSDGVVRSFIMPLS